MGGRADLCSMEIVTEGEGDDDVQRRARHQVGKVGRRDQPLADKVDLVDQPDRRTKKQRERSVDVLTSSSTRSDSLGLVSDRSDDGAHHPERRRRKAEEQLAHKAGDRPSRQSVCPRAAAGGGRRSLMERTHEQERPDDHEQLGAADHERDDGVEHDVVRSVMEVDKVLETGEIE